MPRGQKDVVYTTLVGNGTLSKLYIQSPVGVDIKGADYNVHVLPPAEKKKKKDDIGRGEQGMINWVEFQLSDKFFFAGDLGAFSIHFYSYL